MSAWAYVLDYPTSVVWNVEMSSPTARPEPTAVISAVVAVLGVFGWLLVARIIGLPAMTVALVLGVVALFRIKRNGTSGRWLALVGVGLSAAFFVLVLVVVARDLIDPVTV